MKLLTAVCAATLVASTLVVGATQLRQAAAASSAPPPYFECASGALCVEPLQFRSRLPEINNEDNVETRTSTVYNNTAGPVTITGAEFVDDPAQVFVAGPNETCVGRTLQPGDECGFQVSAIAGDAHIATFEVDGTAGGASGAGPTAVKGTALVQVNEPIPPDADLYADQYQALFEVDHVGATSGPQSIALTGYGAVLPPPVHVHAVHAAVDGPTVAASGAYYDYLWYRVTGATVVDDRPAGFPAEYQTDLSGCAGKSINKDADHIEAGSTFCDVTVTATPHSDGDHRATLDITYCTVEGRVRADCTDAAPRHVLVPLETIVPWNPGPCDSLCVEPLTFLPVDSESGTTIDPVLVRTSTVYNGTATPLTITDTTLQNSDGVFDVHPLQTCLGKTIPPGGECGVSVRLHDDGEPHVRTALVATGTVPGCQPTDSGPRCTVIGIGSVTSRPAFTGRDQDMWADPAELDAGSAIVGTTTAPKTVTLAGWAEISGEITEPQWDRVMNVQVLGAQAADFHADFSDCVNKDVNIDAGMKDYYFTWAGVPSCKLSITATPSATGMRTAYLDVTYCTVDDNEDYTPQADCVDSKTPRHVLVALSALGLAVPPPTGCHALCVEPLDFLPLPEGTDPTKIRTSAVFNGTGQPVTVTAESFVNGANRFDVFPAETCIGRTLPPGGECAVSVRYTDDGAVLPQAALQVDGFHPPSPSGGPVTGRGAITVRTATRPDNDLYAVPSILDFGHPPVGKRTAPLSTTLTGWGATARGPLWYRVLGVSVFSDSGIAQPADYQADGSDCATKAINLKADPVTGFPGSRSCTITVTDLPASPGIRPAALDITYCEVTAPTAPCDGSTVPGHVLVGLTANAPRPTFQPKLAAAPAVSPAGRVVHITGTGFPRDAAFVLALTPLGTPAITDPAVLAQQLMKAGGRTDSNGTFQVDLLIMPNTVAGTRPLQAVATDVFGNQGAAQLPFLIVPGTQQIVPGAPPTVLPRH